MGFEQENAITVVFLKDNSTPRRYVPGSAYLLYFIRMTDKLYRTCQTRQTGRACLIKTKAGRFLSEVAVEPVKKRQADLII